MSQYHGIPSDHISREHLVEHIITIIANTTTFSSYQIIILKIQTFMQSSFFLFTLSLIIPWYETQTLFASVVIPSS
jgi:hypothetical protein